MIAQALLLAVARIATSANVRWADCSPERGQRLYIANHTSHLDFLVIWSALPSEVRQRTRPVAGREYWDRGPVRRWLARRVFRAVLVDRDVTHGAETPHGGRIASARAAIDAMLAGLGEDNSLILFPEGTRGRGGDVAPFRGGLFHLCVARRGLEVVPVYLTNLNRILPRGEIAPVPLLARVTFGRPLTLGAGEMKSDFLQRARAAVERLRDV